MTTHSAPEVVQTRQLSHSQQDGLQHVSYSDKEAVDRSHEHNAVGAQSLPLPSSIHDQNDNLKHEQKPDLPSHTRYCGLSRRTALILLTVLAIAIIAAAVGGGVGGAMAVSNKNKAASPNAESTFSSSSSLAASSTHTRAVSASKSSTQKHAPTSTSTRTTTSSSAALPTAGLGTYPCPSANSTTYAPQNLTLSPSLTLTNPTYSILCNADFPTTSPGPILGTTVADLDTGVIALSIYDCLDFCAANYTGGGACHAATYDANITLSLDGGKRTGNCFMKTTRAKNPRWDNGSQLRLSGFMVGE